MTRVRPTALSPRQAEILLAAARGELWRADRSGKICTSSETVTRQADLLVMQARLSPVVGSIVYRADRTGGPLVTGMILAPTYNGLRDLARLAGWSTLCLAAGIAPTGLLIAPRRDAVGSHHHARLSLDDLAAAGGNCRQDGCPACPMQAPPIAHARTVDEALREGWPISPLSERPPAPVDQLASDAEQSATLRERVRVNLTPPGPEDVAQVLSEYQGRLREQGAGDGD